MDHGCLELRVPSLLHINIHPHHPPQRPDPTAGLVTWRPGPKNCIPLGKFARFCFLAALGSPCRPLGLAGVAPLAILATFLLPIGASGVHLGRNLAPFQPILSHLGCPWLSILASWPGWGGSLGHLGLMSASHRASGVYLGRNLAPCRPILPHLVDIR